MWQTQQEKSAAISPEMGGTTCNSPTFSKYLRCTLECTRLAKAAKVWNLKTTQSWSRTRAWSDRRACHLDTGCPSAQLFRKRPCVMWVTPILKEGLTLENRVDQERNGKNCGWNSIKKLRGSLWYEKGKPFLKNRPDLVYPQLGWCKMTPQVGDNVIIRDCVTTVTSHFGGPMALGWPCYHGLKASNISGFLQKQTPNHLLGQKCVTMYMHMFEKQYQSLFIYHKDGPKLVWGVFFLEEESLQFGNGYKETCLPETDIKTKCSTSHTSHIKHKHTQAMLIHIFGVIQSQS